jgi:hypothetical protein
MTQYYVNIKSSGPAPDPLPVKPGDEVIFQMDGWTITVDVDFGSLSPFSVNQFQLDGGNQLLAHRSNTVLSDAKGSYPYKVFPTGAKRFGGEHPDPPGTVSGDLEVSTGGPK